MKASAGGFTIIEVMLFLAVSGMLLVMIMVGSGTMAARQRFTDSTDSLQAYFMSQYDEVVNNVNTRGGTGSCLGVATKPGTSQDCLLLGRVLTIDRGSHTTITSQYVISSSGTVSGATDADKLSSVSPQVVDDGMTTYDLKWGASVSSASRSGTPSRGAVNTIAFLRLPDSGRIVQLYYDTAASLTTGLRTALASDAAALNPPDADNAPSLAICLKNDSDFTVSGVRSAIYFAQGTGSGTITTNYSPPGSMCP